MIDEVLHQR